ncbi:MAG: FMN-binding protein [Lachnospiraceae bacterium]
MTVHRILTVCLIVCLVIHVADVGIQLPKRILTGNSDSDFNEEQIKEEVNDSTSFSGAQLKDGVYEGAAEGYKDTIKVSVTVENGEVTDIEILEENDTPEFFERAKKIVDDIISKQSLKVDAVSGATYSSVGIINAVNSALESAVVDGEMEKNDTELPAKGHHGPGGSGRHGGPGGKERSGGQNDFTR